MRAGLDCAVFDAYELIALLMVVRWQANDRARWRASSVDWHRSYLIGAAR